MKPAETSPSHLSRRRSLRVPSLPSILDKLPANRHVVLPAEAQTTAGFLLIPRISRATLPAIPAGSGAHPAIPASRMTGQHGRRSAADRARRRPVCRDFVTADNGSSPHPARIPRAVLCSTNARPSPGSRPPRPTHMSRSAREELLRAAVSAPETRALTACGESRLRSRARRGPRRSRDDRLRPTRPWPRAWPRP